MMQFSTLNYDPQWYKDAIIYEVPVRAFSDSNNDGIGDFVGLTGKLDYLQSLGVTALWILPFFPSPLRDDGYDISDYTSVNPIYGTIEDFQAFLEAAHARGIRVIIELIINHTSDQHPWFQRARRAPVGSPERDFYVWSDTPDKYQEARIIFQDFETSNWTWDSVANAYFWHRFYSHQPDLNYDNLAVQQAVFEVLDFWLAMGVDGLRMDAVPYLYEREGTNCENLPETHAFLKKLRKHVESNYPECMLLAEANQWAEDAAAYYGDGDECHMNFHFPLMPRLFMSVRMEDSFPINDILQQTPPIPENCQWGIFLRNHDELTLEMVTDEDRDYMYRVYAQDKEMRVNLGIRRRLAPLLGNDRRQIELLNSLLLTFPGTPVLYYGDEIGMGDNVYVGDRNGVRTPMQWSDDRNAGFSRANPHKLYLPIIVDSEYNYTTVNVEAQRSNPNSLLSAMRRLIATRKRFQAFGRGDFQLLHPENRKVLAFTRTYKDECILVVANLSRFVQTVELDLSAFSGSIPVEVFGRTEFPAVKEAPYFLSLGAYAFYWFSLKPVDSSTQTELPTIRSTWETLLARSSSRAKLENILVDHFKQYRWFKARTQSVQSAQIIEMIPISPEVQLIWLQVSYIQEQPETYVMFIAHGDRELDASVIAQLEEGVLFEAVTDPTFLTILLSLLRHGVQATGEFGQLKSTTVNLPNSFEACLLKGEHNNTSILYGESVKTGAEAELLLKIFRHVEEGMNPDLEIRRFLDSKFNHIPRILGSIEYQIPGRAPMTIAVLQEFIAGAQSTWDYTLDSLRTYFESLNNHEVPEVATLEDIPDFIQTAIGTYLANIQLLGQRTAELHLALATESEHPDFKPEPFTSLYQRSIYQYARNLTGRVFLALRNQLHHIADPLLARDVLELYEPCLEQFRGILDQKITALRTRYHGDYHLGQALYTGKDFVLIDFEGNSLRSLSDRRIKRSPLRDAAGMMQSFHVAAEIALANEISTAEHSPSQLKKMKQGAQHWKYWAGGTFLKSYFETAQSGKFLPQSSDELKRLLNHYLLEKAIASLGKELNERSDKIEIALLRILELLN
ncbi:trehalose synthase [Leptolyngbya boryana NIES-2135]|jgi:maltose alpha-D-glucosyltransferase/alpha-amylase|uniref:maltose alpha-D-glucosyltransferase n=2 Tax=Leptolyngbya TaxID=47251 RepID=A0A1Z4JPV6_LEPBY|nr:MULTISPECIES: maltose alpha-D-glucosyltransferase [Leptolyngbya]BAY58749.1 trehalose synthase [Leptolyngbya boryana NIES-2135]MBN8559281.1 maltose alpha-D-glucosyltransferase [Leptolyngbya sp. UWPOB_LEPTO1]ULP29803.1 maltose alpha-D-glucosyltransferase [Leptolyngbya boryana IU 594]BAS55109.1 trehalose synthase [Leptolyngbya boryana IAM M-101]BAS61457.1 trehalose synthase [Leptolyngbya boryana dg5]